MRLLSRSFAPSIYIDEHTVCGLSLTGVAGHSVTVIQMRMPLRVEIHAALVVQLQAHHAILRDVLYCSKFAVRYLQLLAGRSELDAVAYRKCLLLFPIDRDSHLAAWIVGRLFPIRPQNR